MLTDPLAARLLNAMLLAPAGVQWRSLLIAGLLALMIAAVYGSVVLYDHAWTDDFYALYALHSKVLAAKLQPVFNVQGRPLGGWITQTAFRAAANIEHLRWIRVGNLGLVLAFGLILAAEFRRVVPIWIGLGAVSLMLWNPAVAVYVGWPSSGVLAMPAAVLALAGGAWWLRILERSERRNVDLWLRLSVAGALPLAALTIYQPSACYFLIPAAICLLGDDLRRAFHANSWTACGFAAICGIYFVVFRVVRNWLPIPPTGDAARADFVSDLPERVRFFATYIIGRAFESWAVFFGSAIQCVVITVAAGLTLCFVIRLVQTHAGSPGRWHALLVVAILVGLATSPLLVVKQSYAPFRTLGVLYSLVAVGVAGGVMALRHWLPTNRRAARGTVAALWIGLIMINGVATAYVTREGLVLRSVREFDFYRRFVQGRVPTTPTEVIVVLPEPRELPSLSRINADNEFGTASSFVDWSFAGLLCSVFMDESRGALPTTFDSPGWQIIVHEVWPDGQTLFPADLPVIDAAQALRGGPTDGELPRSGPIVQDRFLGEVQQLTPSLRLCPWLGIYSVTSPTRIVHRDLGELEISGPGGDDCWFHRDGLGWLWTGPHLFPAMYCAERKHWLRYVRGTKHPVEFYDNDLPDRPLIRLE